MNDLLILGLLLCLGILALGIWGGMLFIWQKRDFANRMHEFKMFQMENSRIILQMDKNAERHQTENRQFFKGLTYTVAQIFERVDRESKNE